MPPFPNGGMIGGHVVLHHRQSGTEIAVTLHAWSPQRESVATLRAMAASAADTD